MATPHRAYHMTARATPALVGRGSILRQIQHAVQESTDPVVFYIHGDGGIGKTRLVTEVLRLCREGVWQSKGKPLIAADVPVDLYHTQTHSMEGLVRAMGTVLGQARAYFAEYERELDRLERMKYDLHHALTEMTKLRDQVARVFLDNFETLTADHRTVMAFDTAEMLLYETDTVQRALGLGKEGIGIRPWLINDLLPTVSNAVLLVAGRFREPLLEDLEHSLGQNLKVIGLNQFTPDETQAYFQEVVSAARDQGEEQIAQRVEAIPDETRQVIHLYTQGRPILLALMIDLLAFADRLPEEVKVPLAQAQEVAKSPQALQSVRDKLESEIVQQFQRIGSPIDEAIRSLAFARKGLNPAMLARVADMDEAKAGQALGLLTGSSFDGELPQRKNGLPPMSFVKVRPADQRVFLHDEMYDLMERHVIQKMPEPDVARVYCALLEYYGKEIAETEEKIETLQPQIRQEVSPDRRVIAVPRLDIEPEVLAERTKAVVYKNYLLTEEVHYWLRYGPLQGFQRYCTYAEDAYQESDESLDMQLRDELLAFVSPPDRQDLAEIDGLQRSEVDLDAGIRWIQRLIRRGGYDAAVEVAENLRSECAELIERAGPLGQSRLDGWQGMALAYQSEDLARGESLLRGAAGVLRQLQPPPENAFHRWQKDLELANAYNSLGYLLRLRGRHRQSVLAYRQALPLWRRLGKRYKAPHANTLNNLSWALAELGDYLDARRACKDGLALRRDIGSRYPIALSYNTLGQIQTKDDQPHRARVNCEHALAIFRELEMLRGVGMASVALAEAHRRMSTTGEVYFPEERAHLLAQAAGYATDAVRIFGGDPGLPPAEREPQVDEPARLVDALIEQGCAYRDWAWRRPDYDQRPDEEGEMVTDPPREDLAQLGERALTEAARLAKAQQPHRAVDALVNLAWLKYFVEVPKQAETTLDQVWDIIPTGYRILEGQGLPEAGQDMPWHWVQLSKAHRLLGELAYERYERENELYKRARRQPDSEAAQRHQDNAYEHLERVATEYTLAEAYDELYGQGQIHRDQKRSEEQIYDRLKGLNLEELSVFSQAVQATAQTYRFKEKPRMAELLEKWFIPPEEDVL